MPKRRVITIAAGAAPTEIPCSIPAARVIITESADTPGDLLVTFPADEYVAVSEYQGAVPIVLRGHGFDGILARPVSYNAENVPATAELYCKIKRDDEAETQVIVEEFERNFGD